MMTATNEALYRATIRNFLTVYRYLRRYGRQMHEEGISGRKITTLRYLTEAGALTVGQVSEYLCISDSSTSELIAWLKKNGYVTRRRSEADNRVVFVEVTPLGRELVQRTPLGGFPLLREALKGLPLDRLAMINDAMGTITDLLEIRDEC
jgi:DNA-binding MarR family transcriptional regulator